VFGSCAVGNPSDNNHPLGLRLGRAPRHKKQHKQGVVVKMRVSVRCESCGAITIKDLPTSTKLASLRCERCASRRLFFCSVRESRDGGEEMSEEILLYRCEVEQLREHLLEAKSLLGSLYTRKTRSVSKTDLLRVRMIMEIWIKRCELLLNYRRDT